MQSQPVKLCRGRCHAISLVPNGTWPDLPTREILDLREMPIRLAAVPHHLQTADRATDSGDPLVLIRIDMDDQKSVLLETTAHLLVKHALQIAIEHGMLRTELAAAGFTP